MHASLHPMPLERGKIGWEGLRALLLERIPDDSPATCNAYIFIADLASGRKHQAGGGGGARARGVIANTEQSLARARAEGDEVRAVGDEVGDGVEGPGGCSLTGWVWPGQRPVCQCACSSACLPARPVPAPGGL